MESITETLEIWNRIKDLQIDFEMEEEEEEVSPAQQQALEKIEANPSFFDEAKEAIIHYISIHDPQYPLPIKNIFRIIEPTTLIIPKDQEVLNAVLICTYNAEPAEGIGAEIEEGGLVEVSPMEYFTGTED